MVEDEELSQLLAKVAEGDRHALKKIYDHLGRYLLSVCMKRLGRRDLAEEALQDTFVSIWRSAGSFASSSGSAKAWLATIARRRAIDRLRASPWLSRETDNDKVEPALVDSVDSLPLAQCLSRLDRDSRLAIMMCYLYGMTHDEVSRVTSTPVGTIKSRIRRALLKLRECLTQ